ncbi:MAG TPA: hypothetical protein VE978_23995 [Chitinophagales bacterium]|nr:hypothetical protein [Chitinophagales bacterium]
MITILSCTKESGTKTPDFLPSYAELKLTDTTKKIKVFLYTNSGALKHDSVYTFGLDYQTNVKATDVFTDALWYLHHRLQTGDTTLVYKYPYSDVIANAGSLYAYPDSALQADPKYANFKTWFQRLVTNWMVKHECTECSNIVVSPATSQYFSKITCSVN